METINFKSKEFTCKCGCGLTVKPEIIALAQLIRELYKAPMVITSGARCEKHNKKIGGALHSQHIKSNAIDFYIKGHKPIDVFDYLNKLFPNALGLAHSDNFVHLDLRPDKHRWTY